jgi:uncharacterized membrane protein
MTDSSNVGVNELNPAFARENDGKLEQLISVTITGDPKAVFEGWQNDIQHGRQLDILRDIEFREVINGSSINFASSKDADSSFKGEFQFQPASGGRGTMVSCVMHVDRTFGKLSEAVSTVTGNDPFMLVRRDMRRLKQLAETGEMATSNNNRFEKDKDEGIE